DDLLDYYYGVRASEARPGRPAYEASAGFSPEIGIDAFYLSSGRWIWQAGLTWETFASEIEDSPIVEDSDSLSGYTFISWRF
ncbi:MAG: MipA/OmpV family protein, partial [Acidobacteriota bacterium]